MRGGVVDQLYGGVWLIKYLIGSEIKKYWVGVYVKQNKGGRLRTVKKGKNILS